ncbi:Nucleoporin nup85 [Coemansia aciculifera]|uniref:Nucleoporin nup85 n=1 Tax=Coemansia aciculifera TaxID=417176 RepID=A0ACC1M621_9FUNG|nr:Nucleoporin nup85 [Coemansia aciculifera]
MPVAAAGEAAGAFAARWRRWHEAAEGVFLGLQPSKGDDSDFLDSPPGEEEEEKEEEGGVEGELRRVVDILRGDADAIAAEGGWWLDVVGALLLYSEPTAQADRLQTLAEAVVSSQFDRRSFARVDRTLYALLTHDLAEFLVLANTLDAWLAAHAADMLTHAGALHGLPVLGLCDVREHFLVALAEAYVAHGGLPWRVGVDYLALCGTAGARAVLAECVERAPLDSDAAVQRALRMCSDYRLPADRIHRLAARRSWQRGRLAPAIQHYARVAGGGGRAAVALITEQVWDQYLASGRLSYAPLVDSIAAAGDPALLRLSGVQFLSRYRDFYALYAARQFRDAAQTLLAIIVADIAPPRAAAELLVDAIPLLEGDDLVFDADQTFELMRCAEALQQKHNKAGAIDEGEFSIFSVACARNLARSFL